MPWGLLMKHSALKTIIMNDETTAKQLDGMMKR
jgi:hypothetical protein